MTLQTLDLSSENIRAPRTIELPAPTAWPIILAFGLTLILAGLVTSASVSILGAFFAVSGGVGWFFDVLPHEKHEIMAIVETVPLAETSRPQVARVEWKTEELQRARLPLEIYPISAGVKGGLAGGVAMAVLAVLVAVVTVEGHRTHTEAVLDQNRATDQWNEYQAKKIRSYNTSLNDELLSVLTVRDQEAANKKIKDHADHQAKWSGDLNEQQEKADAFEKKVEAAEARASRFDLGETLLEIGLVVTSVTLLTKSRIYWYFGIVFALAGIASAASAFLLK